MPSFFKTLTLNVLLAGALVVQVANAHPLTDTNVRNLIAGDDIDSDVDVLGDFENRGKKHPKLSTADFPSKGYSCPKTNKYPEITTYTSGQLTKAYAKAAKYANEERYPHRFANYDGLPFPCGSKTMEFVLDKKDPGTVYNGGEVKELPDRLIFEYSRKGETARAQFCGVIRHEGDGFVNCPTV
ncbi:hypothetical protein ANOM_006965 [Aspergillus nomiae NRRL 13137]|uniref:ribonuclease T1 n=1 Tax=Aspergillus nomiae NRRL (strain ATCC 15546 / NRRL 13137 / CBS 260.88 / M93) TaxID=1509407 RepID=A0A0L1IZX8_ASPN3|nr:uncharacterized protein ANOM_006965 [Aspergillus nomiae NRRL 13137]KNG85047.1 hypothetical protein ANOM_006965 [Aspergillus nomiae NRRL 13137]